MAYRRLTEEETKTLAQDIYRGRVFTSWQIHKRDHGLIGQIFMPLLFLSQSGRNQLQIDGIELLYGRMEDAIGRSINGYPIFIRMGTLDQEDARRVKEKYDIIQAAIEGI